MALLVAAYAQRLEHVDTVLVANSCARGQAVPDSDLDMAILLTGDIDEVALDAGWDAYCASNTAVQKFCQRSTASAVHVTFFNGTFTPDNWDDGGGPDDFEIEIGNLVAHPVPLAAIGPHFVALRDRWLPYYDESLRLSRLRMARDACLHDLDFVPFYLARGLFLQAFDRLYKAFREYLQALFIARRTYPIAYNKWLEEQLTNIGRPELHAPLLSVLGVADLTSNDLNENATALRELAMAID